MNRSVCCFFGHRKIAESAWLKQNLKTTVRRLIAVERVDTFLFGSRSEFNDLCYEVVSELKDEFPSLKRIYVRAEFPHVDERYTAYLLQRYEETYFPQKIERAGRAIYIERNFEMIDRSAFCVVYYDAKRDHGRKSGSKIAYEYARKRGRCVINLYDG